MHAMGSPEGERGHGLSVLMLPWLAHGHVCPFLELAKRISHHNILVHFCSTPVILASMAGQLDTKSFPSVRLVELHLPTLPGLPPDLHSTKHLPEHLMPSLKQAFDMAAPSFERLLEALRPDLVIYDFIQPWAPAVARRRSIPAIVFAPNGCAFSALFAHYSMKPEENFPFPEMCRWNGGEDWDHTPTVSDDRRFMNCMVQSSGLIAVKTLRVIEGKYVDYFSGLLGKEVVPVGPLLPADEKETMDEDERRSEAQVMEWLRDKGRSSVVYVSFGSEYFMSKPEMEELAYGLELCGVSFIWVVRFPSGGEGSCREDVRIISCLPDGFLKRTTSTLGKGLVVEGWAPQRKILAHPGVGGFVTHCGWSSVVEALYYGVPMVALPQHLDQPTNAKLVVELGVGMEIKNKWWSGAGGQAAGFKREDVAKVIGDVVVNREGEEVRMKAKGMAEVMRRSGKEEMQVFVDKIIKLCKSRECSDASFC